MARVPDFSGIRQILLPLEESGALVRRTDQEVCTRSFIFLINRSVELIAYVLIDVRTERLAIFLL
jgi:hypothetical protein